MSVKRRRRNIMRDLNNRKHRTSVGNASHARGEVQNTLHPNDRTAADGPPPNAKTAPAVSLLRGRNTYACADDGCAGQFRTSNGYTTVCNRCGRTHQLRTPTITHWQEHP